MQISFSEILLILFIAVLVIKPAHLPDTAIAISRWIKQAKKIINQLKQQIEYPFEGDANNKANNEK